MFFFIASPELIIQNIINFTKTNSSANHPTYIPLISCNQDDIGRDRQEDGSKKSRTHRRQEHQPTRFPIASRPSGRHVNLNITAAKNGYLLMPSSEMNQAWSSLVRLFSSLMDIMRTWLYGHLMIAWWHMKCALTVSVSTFHQVWKGTSRHAKYWDSHGRASTAINNNNND